MNWSQLDSKTVGSPPSGIEDDFTRKAESPGLDSQMLIAEESHTSTK